MIINNESVVTEIQRVDDAGVEVGESVVIESPALLHAQIGDHIRIADWQGEDRPELPEGPGVVQTRVFRVRKDLTLGISVHVTFEVHWR